VVFFIVHGTVENFEFLYANEVMKIGLTILGAVALFFLITRFFIKDTVHAALVCFFICTWLLFYGAIFNWVRSIRLLHFLHSYTIFVPFMLGMFIVFIVFIRKRKLLQAKLCFYLNVLLLIYCVYDSVILIIKASGSNKQTVTTTVKFDAIAVKAKPNVYFLLFDEYPGYKSLKDSFGYANDSMYHFLANRDFTFLPTFANYNMTLYSMSSTLNMRYVEKNFDPLQNTVEDEQRRVLEIKNAQAVQYFKQMGYEFVNYSIFDILDKPGVKGNTFIVSQARLLTEKIFFNNFIKNVGWHFITGKYHVPFIEHLYRLDDRNNKFMEQKLLELAPASGGQPRLVYAHFNMPHAPFFYDSTGKPLSNEQVFSEDFYNERGLFLSYLKYTNTKMEGMVNAICTKDPTAIVIVMSDHGFRHYSDINQANPLYFDNICAVRFPNKNYAAMKEKWSNVNFFPYLFNSQFNQQIPYLADSSIFLRDKRVEE
jgi:hypothetical protein